jgi:anti-sigma regulatory factor (Ser/Thr protein kinase)/ActR/RegA family two-component response regulator
MSVGVNPPSILLADGNEQSRQTFGTFFEGRGWAYDVVPTGSAMVGALESCSYDIIIADVELVGPDSTRVLRDILEKYPAQPIIAVSPSASYDDALRLFRSGATDLLARPVDFSWLERIVKQIVFSRRNDERERATSRFVTSERAEMRFTSADLAKLSSISLPLVGRLTHSGQLSHSDALRVRLAVQEAVLNGLEHGNLELDSRWKEEIGPEGVDKFSAVRQERLVDPEFARRAVVVALSYADTRLEIVVKDEGKGFLNARDVPQGGSIDSLSCSGRGLALMSSSVDEVRFGENGSVVTLIKRLHERKSTEDYGA